MAFFSLIFNKSTYSYTIESELSLKFASQDKGLESKFLWGKFNPQMPGASVQLLEWSKDLGKYQLFSDFSPTDVLQTYLFPCQFSSTIYCHIHQQHSTDSLLVSRLDSLTPSPQAKEFLSSSPSFLLFLFLPHLLLCLHSPPYSLSTLLFTSTLKNFLWHNF